MSLLATRVASAVSKTTAVATRSYAVSGNFTVPINTPYETHLLDESLLPKEAVTNKEELLEYFKTMTYIRRVETASDNLYKAKFIRGFCHLYIGQEAVAVGAKAGLKEADHMITAYRDHAHQIVNGDTGERVLAELMGRSTGCSRGKGGSMHMYYPEKHFWGGHGIVGAQGPLGTGIAFAAKYRKTGGVCLTFYGDGAANQGQLFEAYNMAKLWKIPVVYVCENNRYGMGTSVSRAAAHPDFYKRGGFVPGLKVDGMDIFSVREGTRAAANYAREHGPVIMEMNTYRYQGHSMSDPGTTYRTRDEVNNMRQTNDPITYVKNLLLKHELATEEELKAIERAAREKVDQEAEAAKNAAFPDPSEFARDILLNHEGSVRGADLGQVYYPTPRP
eukprot:TRINITY_DN7126_c0_g2_i1.p1 TRINITY_DN7126_c0_g2~~TRINITY_DN7126_c0_g2_i1.p1  ORF type:complete len:390 (-),score=68.57 TRINITY_DN7126_c0_g2_i1:110-1279(-)